MSLWMWSSDWEICILFVLEHVAISFSEKNNITFHLETDIPLIWVFGRATQILTRCTFQRNALTFPWSQWKLEKFGSLPKNFSTFKRSSLRHCEALELMTGNDVQLGTKKFSSPTNALTLQTISTFYTGIKLGQSEVTVCIRLLRERHIQDSTLMIRCLLVSSSQMEVWIQSNRFSYFFCCFLILLYLFIYFSLIFTTN